MIFAASSSEPADRARGAAFVGIDRHRAFVAPICRAHSSTTSGTLTISPLSSCASSSVRSACALVSRARSTS